MPLDIAHWLAAVSDDAPAGPNLEFDADFGALERAARGKPAQEYGDTVIPGEEPDWRDVEAQALALLERTRDLRVVANLAVARLHQAGLAGFAEALTLIREMLETQWDSVHPQLDPEDDNDPTLRANALLVVAEPGRVLRTLRDLPLVSVRSDRVSWRDIAVQSGIAEQFGAVELESGRKPLTEREIRGLFEKADAAQLAAVREAIGVAVAETTAIPAVFDRHAGAGTGPDFKDLLKLLRQMAHDIARLAPAPGATAAEAPAPPEGETDAAEPAADWAARPRPGGVATLGAISTRAEAVRLLDLVVQYYERYEPSSPLPLLIERARRLADKTFLDILRDLAPDGLGQAQNVAGVTNE